MALYKFRIIILIIMKQLVSMKSTDFRAYIYYTEKIAHH